MSNNKPTEQQLPQTGGSFSCDPETGKLRKREATKPAPEPKTDTTTKTDPSVSKGKG